MLFIAHPTHITSHRAQAKAKKSEVQGVLGPMTEDRFKDLLQLSTKITDFVSQADIAAAATDNTDETQGVSVNFDRDEEEVDSFLPCCQSDLGVG
jgi:hypothetical protein